MTTVRLKGEKSKMVGTNKEIPINISITKPKYTVTIKMGDVQIVASEKIPNRWYRFWYWALLGWTWEKVENPKDVPKEKQVTTSL